MPMLYPYAHIFDGPDDCLQAFDREQERTMAAEEIVWLRSIMNSLNSLANAVLNRLGPGPEDNAFDKVSATLQARYALLLKYCTIEDVARVSP